MNPAVPVTKIFMLDSAPDAHFIFKSQDTNGPLFCPAKPVDDGRHKADSAIELQRYGRSKVREKHNILNEPIGLALFALTPRYHQFY
jgi:hypothetical protein